MKKSLILIFLLCIMIIGLGSCSSLILRHDSNDGRLIKEIKTEPLVIVVIDRETNQPLSGITVYHQLEKRSMHLSLFNPEGHTTARYSTI